MRIARIERGSHMEGFSKSGHIFLYTPQCSELVHAPSSVRRLIDKVGEQGKDTTDLQRRPHLSDQTGN